MAGMIASALFFFRDVVVDLSRHFTSATPYSWSDLVHLSFEAASVIFMMAGLILLRERIQHLKERDVLYNKKLQALREDFDALVHKKFDSWKLTTAEADVALLLLRGLGTGDIAELRQSAIGTVKVQAHHVLQKAGVSSRVELMSLFLDEFIDVGLENVEHRGPQST